MELKNWEIWDAEERLKGVMEGLKSTSEGTKDEN